VPLRERASSTGPLQALYPTTMSFLSDSRTRNILQIVLAIVIIVLGYVLFEAIQSPAREFAQQQELTERSRERMSLLRRGLVAYEREYTGYPRTLDSLQHVIRSDSFFVSKRDSIFQLAPGQTLEIDSLVYTVRGPRFEYHVVRDDTANVWTYVLRNPVTADSIGTRDVERAGALRHVASWE
jgi:hypothetical protein